MDEQRESFLGVVGEQVDVVKLVVGLGLASWGGWSIWRVGPRYWALTLVVIGLGLAVASASRRSDDDTRAAHDEDLEPPF